MKNHIASFFLISLIITVCLCISVCLRQNVFSMIHLIFLICFPLFQTSKHHNINDIFQCNRLKKFVKLLVYKTLIILILKIIYIIVVYVTPQYQNMNHSCDTIGQLLRTLGMVNEIFDVTLDAVLLIIFAIVFYYFPKNDSTIANLVSISIPVYEKNYYSIFVSKYSCLAAMCLSGIMVPSFACSIYYILFAVFTTAIVLFKLSNKTIACLFRTIFFYTSFHIFMLFTYQIEWIQNIKMNMSLKQFGLIAFHNSKCYISEVLPELELNNYLLPILLIIQHHMLWTYSNMISKNASIENSTQLKIFKKSEFILKYILIGITTIGFKIGILVWCICYPGWLTFVMLLWTIVFWMYLNSRGNLIIILLLAISTLLCEYTYIVTDNNLLKQVFGSYFKEQFFSKQLSWDILIKTLLTITFWIALDQVDQYKSNEVNSKLWSINSKYYISYIWTASMIFIMITYGFFGYHKINLIQIGYITLALLFLIIFQVSFQVWNKTLYLYWTVIMLYCIIVITITYIFQLHGFADILITHLHISNELLSDIGLDKTDSFKTILPATISITILVQFQYFYKHLMSSLNIKIPINISKTIEEQHKTAKVHLAKKMVFSKILNILILVLHLHLNKVLIMLVMILIMSKACLLNLILLIIMLLWILLDYNKIITNILFLHITLYIIVILGYQISYFSHEKFIYQFQLSIIDEQYVKLQNNFTSHQLNIAELIGIKKIDTNELLINFLAYKLLILSVMVLQKIILVYLEFKYYPQKPSLLIFPNIAFTDTNKGIPELVMYLANNGFSLFGLEITFTAIATVIYLSLDVYALLCALWLLRFAVKNRQTVSIHWSYFVIYVYLVIIIKYMLHIETTFIPNSDNSWKTINIINNSTIILYDVSYSALIRPLTSFDFILLVFASHLLTVFKKERLQISDENHFLENNTTYEYFSDYLSQTNSYLDVLKKIIFNNSIWLILFFIFWTGTSNVDIFSLGYLCAGTLFFWKGTYYFLMPLNMILQLWNGLLKYTITVMFIKVLLHLLGCLILNYLEWHSCIFMRVFSIFCPVQTSEKQTCGTFKNDIGLLLDVLIFTLVLFQRRFFESGHFLKLIDDTKVGAVLASKMCHLVNAWEQTKKDENRKIDLDSLEKIKVKLNNIRESKKQLSKTQSKHSRACLDGEFMFEKIYDDVHLVVKYDTRIFSKYHGDAVNGSWLYRQFVYFVFHLTEKMNSYSEEHRQIMETLNAEKKLLMKDSELFKLGQHEGSSMLWTPIKTIINITDYDMRYHEDVNKHKHWSIQFILAIWNVIQSSTHVLCYFSIFYNAIQNSNDIISLIPVAMVLLWGQLSVPRPTKTFWIVLITYMQITGLVKYICSFKEIPWIHEEVTLLKTSLAELYLYPTMRIGIGNYPNKILTDLIVLLLLFLHRRTLVRLGLWTCNDQHKGWIVDKKMLQYKNVNISSLSIKTHLRPINEFYQALRKYHTEGSVDVYPTMLLLLVIQIPLIIMQSSTFAESFTFNRISGMLRLSHFLYPIIIILDRWFYAKRFVRGKLIFHIFFVSFLLLSLVYYEDMGNINLIDQISLYFTHMYILVSAYQIRNGYLYRHASSFLWSRYTIFNLMAYKLYYYCPFVHEIRTVLDWIWTDSSLTIMEWFKMDELFTHVCCIKSIYNFRQLVDSERGGNVSWIFKLFIGGGIIIAILTIIIFPLVWFSMFKSEPDTPSSMELTVKFGEDSTVFSTKSDDIHRLDRTDVKLMKDIYDKSSKINKVNVREFSEQYKFDEISSINVIPQAINTWPITAYEFNKFKKIILTSSNIKITAEWVLTHHDGVKISRGKNTVIMKDYMHSVLTECLEMLNKSSNEVPGSCKQVVIPNLIPKFLVLHLKSTETAIKSELMIHNPSKPYMDVGLTFHYEDVSKSTYWWDLVEICPGNDTKTSYLRKLPYSSCADIDINLSTMNNSHMDTIYNIYVFSDRYSSTIQFLDDKGISGLYTIIIVYIGYKLAFDIFRSFKFKLGYTETPYPDRILQLCYEIYLVRFFKEYEMEEDLYAMLIYLFRSPETLIRYTRLPD